MAVARAAHAQRARARPNGGTALGRRGFGANAACAPLHARALQIPSEDDDPEDEPDPRHLIEAEPKELRPRPGRYDYDPNHARIPVSDDELADWFAEVVRNYELVERLGALRGRPKRPA